MDLPCHEQKKKTEEASEHSQHSTCTRGAQWDQTDLDGLTD